MGNMNEGKLNEKGVKNLQALDHLSKSGMVEYDFQFHSLSMPTDVQVMSLSCSKSLISNDCSVNLKSEYSIPLSDPLENLSPAILDAARNYLEAVSLLQFSIDETVSQQVEDDFVKLRAA